MKPPTNKWVPSANLEVRSVEVQRLIEVKVVALQDLFSDQYYFRLPYFQRAYAWRTPEVGRLLADIADAMASEQADSKGYFLGKLMLAKQPDAPETSLVDGQQRVLSLTILFAVLRDLETHPSFALEIDKYVNSPMQSRIQPQEHMSEFFRKFVQESGATVDEPEVGLLELSETERNIIENRNYFRAELVQPEWTPIKRRQLAEFLAKDCCVIASSVADEDVAWKMLRIEEDTRVDFSPSDCSKWSLLSSVPADERPACQRIWERCEALLGGNDLHALLGHVRTLMTRKRSERPVEVDLSKILRLHQSGAGLTFFESGLLPSAEQLARLRKVASSGSKHAGDLADIAPHLERMSWINPQVWVPAALLWLEKGRTNADTVLFFKRLERMVWTSRLAGHDPSKQQSSVILLLGEIDRGLAPDVMVELSLRGPTRAAVLANLRSPTFDAKHHCYRVLRRINIALGQDPGPAGPDGTTIEHILPQAFIAKSDWRRNFPNRKILQAHAHTLGNLTLLTASENQAADTQSWNDKRPILANSKLLLANRLAATTDWTPQSITSRTEDLIRILFEAWDLQL